jgi:hypothetical protein
VITISPGRLLKLGEDCRITSTEDAELTLRKRVGSALEKITSARLAKNTPWHWRPDACGFYVAEISGGAEKLQRSIAVVNEEWAVCQITVGAFTAEDFADTLHPAGLSADYYVHPSRNDPPEIASLQDKRWPVYERQFGDAIHPHVMAADMGFIDPKFGHNDSNWDTLPLDGAKDRLRALQDWCAQNSYEPLDRIATYTPSNTLVQACSEVGIRIIHSLIPEQNWSDGEWSINHWGMPTCPFWISHEDFRKPGVRHPRSVIGMTMNHYQVTLAHLTHWGDFVLSPSHFDRWIRSAEVGPQPVRFRQFLKDVINGWDGLTSEPFFFVAGFEFGRTFGTTRMSSDNRQGIEALIALAGTEKLVFATSRDVLAYHDRHIEHFAGRAFRQRDSWAGVTVNGKQALAGDSVVVEKTDYKSATLEGELLPYFYYDYTLPWKFAARDQNAPDNYAAACGKELSVVREGTGLLTLRADHALSRPVPVVIWDATPEASPFPSRPFPALDDNRTVVLLEVPKGWSGTHQVKLQPTAALQAFQGRPGWKIQTLGLGELRHSYLILDLPVTGDVTIPIRLKKTASLDSAQEALGMQAAGILHLTFGPLKRWYRFWHCGVDDIDPPDLAARHDLPLLPENWIADVEAHESALHAAALKKLKGGGTGVLLEVLCGGNLPLGTRSRAAAFDRVALTHSGMDAKEFGDGAISFGPGRSFWYHPRGLSFKIRAAESEQQAGLSVLLNSFDPLGLDASYKVRAQGRDLGIWKLPASPFDEQAWFRVELTKEDFSPDGHASISLATNQVQLLHDWWKDRGFIAALHALWIEPA